MTISGATYREGVAISPDGAVYVTLASGSSVTGVTQTGGAGNTPFALAKSGLPLIGLSSGSVAANGAISGITALPAVYPHAFCYFPANILATVKAAGWYYCTFSTTTAGVAFLDSWTPGTAPPTVPASPTAVTDGKGAFTGDTTEQGLIVPVAAGALGANGQLAFQARFTYTNSVGTKTWRFRFSGAAGTALVSSAPTTTVATVVQGILTNDGTTGAQSAYGNVYLAPATLGAQATTTLATVDTTVATDFRITMQRNTATDNTVIESFNVNLLYGA